ncbi:WhiB family transcriptional regulator [Demequina sp.]|uniref:WhiB family transcriptional regulator n=1 Tax=Demequina sp. TaxID=2050685 RepID=UPI003D09D4DC
MTNRMPTLPNSLAHDWPQLVALVDRYRDDTPCRTGHHAPCAWFTSDDEREQRAAAGSCAICPVLDACREFGLTHPKEVGVYGGLTTSERNSRK